MKHYLLKTSKEELKIMGVKPEDEAAFHAEYDKEIVFSGDSIQELLIRWGELLKEAPTE